MDGEPAFAYNDVSLQLFSNVKDQHNTILLILGLCVEDAEPDGVIYVVERINGEFCLSFINHHLLLG